MPNMIVYENLMRGFEEKLPTFTVRVVVPGAMFSLESAHGGENRSVVITVDVDALNAMGTPEALNLAIGLTLAEMAHDPGADSLVIDPDGVGGFKVGRFPRPQ
jgi:hypothetical protein